VESRLSLLPLKTMFHNASLSSRPLPRKTLFAIALLTYENEMWPRHSSIDALVLPSSHIIHKLDYLSSGPPLRSAIMKFPTISAEKAAALDKELVSRGFSIEALMEIAGLAVAQTVHQVVGSNGPNRPRILVLAGPGNNGGDGLVAARHLWWWGYHASVFYPKRSRGDLFERLVKQLHSLRIPFVDEEQGEEKGMEVSTLNAYDHIIDAVFGFSFHGPIRTPFVDVIHALEETTTNVTSVDAPSSWDIADGPPPPDQPGHRFHPSSLISLTAPKPCTRLFRGRHFLGGRFLDAKMEEAYALTGLRQLYSEDHQIVELPK